MKINFYKYQGTGNDFILADNRNQSLPAYHKEWIASLCHRRFGIGADGFIALENAEGYDFKMVYFNSDGNESTMCGNGGRCLVRFAHDLGIIGGTTRFLAVDGPHEAEVFEDRISLKMQDVEGVEQIGGDFYLNTGSPHYVHYLASGLDQLNILPEARAIRYNDRFHKEGTNVNYVEDKGDYLAVRTYERGVEDETYSCGTGVTAVALVNHLCSPEEKEYRQVIQTPGGRLEVSFRKTGRQQFVDVWLHGPARHVFSGEVYL